MTDAPDMEPAALEAAIATHDRILALPATPDDQKLIAEIIRAYLAARSAPEAGKAVDDGEEVSLTAGSPSRGAVAPSSVGIESGPANQDAEQARMERENEAFHKWWEESGHAAEPIYTLTAENACHAAWQARAALASSPAPTGAEPVAWRVRVNENGRVWYVYTERLPYTPDDHIKILRDPEPLYAGHKVQP